MDYVRILLVITVGIIILCPGCSVFTSGNADPVDLTTINSINRLKRIGLEYQERQEYQSAIAAFKRAAALAPNDSEANNLLGRAYYFVGDTQKAKMYLKIAIAQKSEYAEAYYNLGDVYYREGDLDAAMNSYKTAISINEAFRKRIRMFY